MYNMHKALLLALAFSMLQPTGIYINVPVGITALQPTEMNKMVEGTSSCSFHMSCGSEDGNGHHNFTKNAKTCEGHNTYQAACV